MQRSPQHGLLADKLTSQEEAIKDTELAWLKYAFSMRK